MTDGREPSASRNLRLDEVIAAYLEATATGNSPDRQELLDRHPDLATDLVAFFAGHDRMRAVSTPLDAAANAAPPRTPGAVTLPPQAAETEGATLPPSGRPTPPPPGTKVRYFGDYELVEEIARGGMGVVYKARQVNLNRIVALKMILAGQLAGEDDVKRFYTEAEAAAKLDHPGIVPIFEIGEHEGQHYFSMGYIEGSSLANRVADGPLPPREAAEMVVKIAAAVEYAHQQGIIHRDLKPANVLLDANGQPRVTDFGLAKQMKVDSGLTGTGQILGTPSYMPPEQAAGKSDEIGPAADVYALGAILYCLLTGRPPFQSSNPMDTLLAVLDQEPVPPRQLNAQTPWDLETIALKCLVKSPPRRYATARELADELERYLAGRPILARPVGRVERAWRWCKRNPVVASLSAAICLAIVGIAIGGSIVAVHEAGLRQAAEEGQQAAAEAGAKLQTAYLEQVRIGLDALEQTATAKFSQSKVLRTATEPNRQERALGLIGDTGPLLTRMAEQARSLDAAAQEHVRQFAEKLQPALRQEALYWLAETSVQPVATLHLPREPLTDANAGGAIHPSLLPTAIVLSADGELLARYAPADPNPAGPGAKSRLLVEVYDTVTGQVRGRFDLTPTPSTDPEVSKTWDGVALAFAADTRLLVAHREHVRRRSPPWQETEELFVQTCDVASDRLVKTVRLAAATVSAPRRAPGVIVPMPQSGFVGATRHLAFSAEGKYLLADFDLMPSRLEPYPRIDESLRAASFRPAAIYDAADGRKLAQFAPAKDLLAGLFLRGFGPPGQVVGLRVQRKSSLSENDTQCNLECWRFDQSPPARSVAAPESAPGIYPIRANGAWAVSPDGRWLAGCSSSFGKPLELFVVDTASSQAFSRQLGDITRPFVGSRIASLAFSPDSRVLAVVTSENIQVLTVPDNQTVLSQPLGLESQTQQPVVWLPGRCEFAAHCARLAVCLRAYPQQAPDQLPTSEEVVRVWDVAVPKIPPPRQFRHEGEVAATALAAEGQGLYFAGSAVGMLDTRPQPNPATSFGNAARPDRQPPQTATPMNQVLRWSTSRPAYLPPNWYDQISVWYPAYRWQADEDLPPAGVSLTPNGHFDATGKYFIHQIGPGQDALSQAPTEVLEAATGRQVLHVDAPVLAYSADYRYLVVLGRSETSARPSKNRGLADEPLSQRGLDEPSPEGRIMMDSYDQQLVLHRQLRRALSVGVRILDLASAEAARGAPREQAAFQGLVPVDFRFAPHNRYLLAVVGPDPLWTETMSKEELARLAGRQMRGPTTIVVRMTDGQTVGEVPGQPLAPFPPGGEHVLVYDPGEGTPAKPPVCRLVELATARILFEYRTIGRPGEDLLPWAFTRDGSFAYFDTPQEVRDPTGVIRVRAHVWSPGKPQPVPLESSWFLMHGGASQASELGLQLSADGKRLVVVGPGTSAKAETPPAVSELERDQSRGRVLELWDVEAAKLLVSTADVKGSVSRTRISPATGSLLIAYQGSASYQNYVRAELRDLDTGNVVAEFHPYCELSPDGKYLLEHGAKFRVIDLTRREESLSLEGQPWWSGYQGGPFTPDGKKLLVRPSAGSQLQVWHLDQKRMVVLPVGKASPPADVRSPFAAVSPDSARLTTFEAGQDSGIKVWDLDTGRLLQTLDLRIPQVGAPPATPGTLVVQGFAWSPDGRVLGVVVFGQMRLIDVTQAKVQTVLPRPGHHQPAAPEAAEAAAQPITAWNLALSPDGRLLASAGQDQTVGLWDAQTGRYAGLIEGLTMPVRQVAFHPAGDRLLARTADGPVTLWKLAPPQLQPNAVIHATLLWKAPVAAGAGLALSADGELIAAGTKTGVILLRTPDGSVVRTLASPSPVRAVDLRPDGQVVAAGCVDGQVRLWQVGTGAAAGDWDAGQGELAALVFAGTGDLVVTAATDLRVWQPLQPQPLLTLKRHTRAVRNLAMSRDGRLLASAGEDQSVVVWELGAYGTALEKLGLAWTAADIPGSSPSPAGQRQTAAAPRPSPPPAEVSESNAANAGSRAPQGPRNPTQTAPEQPPPSPLPTPPSAPVKPAPPDPATVPRGTEPVSAIAPVDADQLVVEQVPGKGDFGLPLMLERLADMNAKLGPDHPQVLTLLDRVS